MKVSLLYINEKLPLNADDLIIDLGLNQVIETMAGNDKFIFDTCTKVLLTGVNDETEIAYRHDVLVDAINNPSIVEQMYQILNDASTKARNRLYFITKPHPIYLLYESISVLEIFIEVLGKIKTVVGDNSVYFKSEGFRSFFKIIFDEFNLQYITMVMNHINNLRFNNGITFRCEIGSGNKLVNYILLKPDSKKRLAFLRKREEYSYNLPAMDEGGAQILDDMRNAAVADTAEIIKMAADNALGFINDTKAQIAFYVGCINLHKKMKDLGEPTAIPRISKSSVKFKGLYDISLSLAIKGGTVKNSLEIEKPLVIVTGPNSGGKSTLLRSLGQAQLMLRAGMFVPAEYYEGPLLKTINTHFRRGESAKMEAGNFENELVHIKAAIENTAVHGLVLLNEPFSSTNAIEATELSRQIIDSLIEGGVHVVVVTHFYELAWEYIKDPNAVFLKAERKEDGTRTFRIVPGEPSFTSYGEEIFLKVFGDLKVHKAAD
ncbi:MAG: hypothetical protein JRN26_07810 [Nitrososphaerota archaeon]|jgi:DNA mismatch repair ATPase MutS|nr:hypothetical protein [Nitrososphaerota archaeon]MDG6927279.1 hypothetical protein [Nitrososphaerota archaeon]MDG6930363.1 hypothetical protein [Nitrososphaerota archaeon]MDG6931719.1 hypothetical protein [Nitrososphaerota archaeon]MDG6936767.1 hypothetical protein [Nitrososphaerota archaeon]